MRNAALTPALLALAGGLVSSTLFDRAPARAQEAAALAGPDTQFLADAIREGLAEVEMGKMAAQKASDPEVKRLAERMVQDHAEANRKLSAVAEKHQVEAQGTYGTPPLRPDEEETAKKRDLSGMSGQQFDRAYIDAMVADHERAVGAFKDAAKNGQDEEVRGLAEATLPTLEEHLRLARSLAGQVGAPR